MPHSLSLGLLTLTDHPEALFALRHPDLDTPLLIHSPAFELDRVMRGGFKWQASPTIRELPHGGIEAVIPCAPEARLNLQVTVRAFPHSPIVRLKYRLTAPFRVSMTKSAGADAIHMGRIDPGMTDHALTEYQLSHFDPVIHSYMPLRVDRRPADLLPGLTFTGPVALLHNSARTSLTAYEHGADHPDGFFAYTVEEDGLKLDAIKGTYYHGQMLSTNRPWESVWLECGLAPGGVEEFLPHYRRFFLEEVCENRESRKPYVYYNTWNYQERQKYFHNRPYLESMHAERMLQEIDAAHKLGVDVFVVDTGWYEKTGDWLPNLRRFPEGLKEIKRRLDQYGMKLGLWFNPTVAALTSRPFREHPEWEMQWQDKPRWRGPVWETEESTSMCLVSDYADDFIETMVRLNHELGVTYFKWDAVQQYGCDSPNHHHGSAANTPQERADCYAYQMGLSMVRIVEAVTRRCPGVIVDFDITEGGRFVGLGFLSAGKYFLVNNGPYFSDFDIPRTVKIDPDTINVFFYPGPARPRVCRQGIKYDPLIPSILFLTHYLPDPPRLSQRNSLAALVLGGSGWWGDLPALPEEDLTYLGEQIALYKRVGEGITRAFPRVQGFPGASPEIYEKITPELCSGAVVFFTHTHGTVTHITQPLNLEKLEDVVGADAWERVEGGRLRITVTLEKDDARVVFVVAKDEPSPIPPPRTPA